MPATVVELEAQKAREACWVERGADRFLAQCERASKTHAESSTVAGRLLMKMAYGRLVERLEAYEMETAKAPHAAKDLLLPVLKMLKREHVAALTMSVMIGVVWSVTGSVKKDRIILRAKALGEAIVHDLQLRAWSKNAAEVERSAIASMKHHMEADPRSWRRRAKKLRELAEGQWDDVDVYVVGLDLLKLAAEAAPDVFKVALVNDGAQRTVFTICLTDEASLSLSEACTAASVSAPKIGPMLVPPRPWSYAT